MSATGALLPSLLPAHSTLPLHTTAPIYYPEDDNSGHTRPRYQHQSRPSKSLINDHPFFRAYGSIMGQVPSRGGVELEVCPSTGPDPTIFKQHPRFPNVQVVSNTQHQPQSAPMRTARTVESIYTPRSTPAIPSPTPHQGGPQPVSQTQQHQQSQNLSSSNPGGLGRSLGGLGLSVPKPNGFASKPRSLVRKLSRKSPPPPPVQVQNQSKKSMGPDPFEARPFSPLQSAFDPIEMLGKGDGPGTMQFQQQHAPGLGLGSGPEELGMGTGAKKVKAGTFPRGGAGLGSRKTSGVPNLPTFDPSRSSTAFPITTRPSPAIANTVQEPSQIRSASGSIHSHHKTSIKSSPSKRAEREWRAKVAGLAINNRSPKAGSRGPVPPKRTTLAVTVPAPGPTNMTRQGSGGLVKTPITPSPLRSQQTGSVPVEDDKGTPAKSFVSNRSFETLGHHPNPSPSRLVPAVRQLSSTASPGSRQCDVPRSVVSSFYFDNRVSRVSTHISPLVQSQSQLPALTVMTETQTESVSHTHSRSPSAVGNVTGSESPGPRNNKSSLPPFSSFLLSPASVGPPLSPVPGGQKSNTNTQAMGQGQPSLLPSVPGARRSVSRTGAGHPQTLTQSRASYHEADLTLATSQSSSSSGPTTPLRSEAGLEDEPGVEAEVSNPIPNPMPKTPISNKHHLHSKPPGSGPGSPYSPTTAYIIQAEEIDHSHLFAGFHGELDLGRERSGSVGEDEGSGSRSRQRERERERHPYAYANGRSSMFIDNDSPPPRVVHAPLHIQKQTRLEASGQRRTTQPLCPRHEVVSPPCRHTPHLPNHTRQQPQPQPHRHRPAHTHAHDHDHRHHHHFQEGHGHGHAGIKADLIGESGSRSRSYGASGSTVLSSRKVDLTPGMDSGYRPPKSGLPVAVSSYRPSWCLVLWDRVLIDVGSGTVVSEYHYWLVIF